MKNIKWSSIIISICYIAGGFLFFLDANLTKDLICSIIGYILLAVGVFSVIAYFAKSKLEGFLRNDFRDGLIIITVGLLPLIRKDLFIELVYSIIAILIMVSGYKKLQDCVDAWRIGYKKVALYVILSAISIIFGLIIMLDTTINIASLHKLIGISLLFSGVSDLISTIFLSRKMAEVVNIKQTEDKPVEEETIDENNNPEEQ